MLTREEIKEKINTIAKASLPQFEENGRHPKRIACGILSCALRGMFLKPVNRINNPYTALWLMLQAEPDFLCLMQI